QRLGDAVKALETIRLNLLRLRAGSGSVQSLTTDLGLAREVAGEIDRLLEGRREIGEELRWRRATGSRPGCGDRVAFGPAGGCLSFSCFRSGSSGSRSA